MPGEYTIPALARALLDAYVRQLFGAGVFHAAERDMIDGVLRLVALGLPIDGRDRDGRDDRAQP